MAINYKKYEFRCYEYVRRFETLLQTNNNGNELQKWLKDTQRLCETLESRRFRVAVVGEFNRGKTSFVNALLGKEILPADLMPATAAINRITYGDTPSAYIALKNGQKKAVEITELAGYITKLSVSAMENAARIDEAVVQFPSLFCRSGVDLIDTPGMNDEEAMNQVTVSRLEDIDLAIIAVDASMPFSMTECAFTVQLLESPQVCQIVLVITKIDTVRQRERQKLVDFMADRVRTDVARRLEQSHSPDDPIMQKYHAIFDSLCVFAVSSLDALDALARNDMELFENSGFRRLNDELPQIIMSSQNNNVILNSDRVLRGLIRQYRSWILSRKEQREAVRPRLQTAKTTLIHHINESISRVYPRPEQEMALSFLSDSDSDKVYEDVRKKFIQALSRMRTLSYEELRSNFSPVIQKTFQTLNGIFYTQENALLEKRRTALKKEGYELLRKLDALFTSLLPPQFALPADIGALPYAFRLAGCAQPEMFYWVSSPLPDSRLLGAQGWQVMPFVDKAIRESRRDYRERRQKQLARMLAQSKKQLEDAAQSAISRFIEATDRYVESLDSRAEDGPVLDALTALENDCRTLRELFQAELRNEETSYGSHL